MVGYPIQVAQTLIDEDGRGYFFVLDSQRKRSPLQQQKILKNIYPSYVQHKFFSKISVFYRKISKFGLKFLMGQDKRTQKELPVNMESKYLLAEDWGNNLWSEILNQGKAPGKVAKPRPAIAAYNWEGGRVV